MSFIIKRYKVSKVAIDELIKDLLEGCKDIVGVGPTLGKSNLFLVKPMDFEPIYPHLLVNVSILLQLSCYTLAKGKTRYPD